jgi:hypothetical protein
MSALVPGALMLLYTYAYASMVPPELSASEFWPTVLGRMFGFGLPSTLVAIVLLMSGSWLIAAGIWGNIEWTQGEEEKSPV